MSSLDAHHHAAAFVRRVRHPQQPGPADVGVNVDGREQTAEADEVVEVVDVVRVPVVLADGAQEAVLDADLLVLLPGPPQFLVHIAGGHEGTIGVVHLFPIQRYRVQFCIFERCLFDLLCFVSHNHFSFFCVAPHRTGSDGGFLKARPGRLDEADLQHAAMMLRCLTLPFRIRGVRVPSPEKKSSYFFLSQHPPQLLDTEEGDKSHENDQSIGEKFIVPFPQKIGNVPREPRPLPKDLDHILEHGKDTEKKSEDGGLVEGGVDQGLLFKAATEAKHSSDHDDLCKDQRFDHGKSIIRVCYIMGSQKESSVHCEGCEDEREINDIYPVLDQLMEYFFFQALFLIRAVHDLYLLATRHSFFAGPDFRPEDYGFFSAILLTALIAAFILLKSYHVSFSTGSFRSLPYTRHPSI